jgi:glycosyltransferase involved in cell wall biosynthesis
MIVRNEERNLAECLTPVAHLFDEIIIVDTGSHDATVEIARRFTPHVHFFQWCDDFAAARNESLRHATGDWVFWLDADDRLDAANVERLGRLLGSMNEQPRAFMMDTHCRSTETWEESRLITHPRLFRRHPLLAWRGRVHEQVTPCPSTLGYELLWSDVQIQHLGYADASLQQRKLHRDVRLLRMDYAIDPANPSTLLHLGMAYARLTNYPEARKYLQALLAQEHQGPHEYLRRVYSSLIEVAMREGDMRAAIEWSGEGLARFPDDQHLLYLLADALYEVDQFNAARDTLMRIILGPDQPQYHGGTPRDIKRKLAPRSLGDVFRVQGDHPAAEATLRGLVEEFPHDAVCWHSLGRLYIDMQDRQKLREVIENVKRCPQGDVFAALLGGAWHLLRHEFEPANLLIEELIAKVPQMPLPRLMRAELLSRCNATISVRKQAYGDLLRLQPGNLYARQVVARLAAAESAPVPVALEGWSTSVMVGAGV